MALPYKQIQRLGIPLATSPISLQVNLTIRGRCNITEVSEIINTYDHRLLIVVRKIAASLFHAPTY